MDTENYISQAAITDSQKITIKELTKIYLDKNYNQFWDLITLSRMAEDKNVCLYLLELNFKNVALHAICTLGKRKPDQRFLNELMRVLSKILEKVNTDIFSWKEATKLVENITKKLNTIEALNVIKQLINRSPSITNNNDKLLNKICKVLFAKQNNDIEFVKICIDIAAYFIRPRCDNEYLYLTLYNLVLYANINTDAVYEVIHNICIHYADTSFKYQKSIREICKFGIKQHLDELLYTSDALLNVNLYSKDLWKRYAAFSIAIELGLYDFDGKMFIYILKNVSIHMLAYKDSNCNMSTCLMWPLVKYLEIFTAEELYSRLGCLAHFGVIDCLKYIISLPVFWKSEKVIKRHIRYLRRQGVDG